MPKSRPGLARRPGLASDRRRRVLLLDAQARAGAARIRRQRVLFALRIAADKAEPGKLEPGQIVAASAGGEHQGGDESGLKQGAEPSPIRHARHRIIQRS